MHFTDIFIRRPVLATVVSLLVLVLGLRASASLPVRQYPEDRERRGHGHDAYYGASADLVAGFITTPLEPPIAAGAGHRLPDLHQRHGRIDHHGDLRLNYDSNRALSEISTQGERRPQPAAPRRQQPVITVQVGRDHRRACTWASTATRCPPTRSPTTWSAWCSRSCRRCRGCRRAEMLGGAPVRPARLARPGEAGGPRRHGRGRLQPPCRPTTTCPRVGTHQGPDGQRRSHRRHRPALGRGVQAACHQAEGRRDRAPAGRRRRSSLGAEDYDSDVAFSGKSAVFIGIKVAPEANMLDVIDRPSATPSPRSSRSCPPGCMGTIVYDATGYINSSIREVVKTLVEALAHRDGGDLPVPGQRALGDHSRDRDAAVAGRHLLHHARARLLHQPADAAGAGAGHRPGGGRCDHRGRERRPAHEARPAAAARRR